MTILIAGLILFFVPHSLSMINEPLRNRIAARMGELRWQGVFGLFALTSLGLIIWGYGLARQAPVFVYAPPLALRYLTMVLMLPAMVISFVTYTPGRISDAIKHPTLVSTLVWAAAHLLSNGNLADLLLFGAFLLWSSADLYSMTWRNPKPIPTLPRAAHNDLIALAAGSAIYVAFLFWLHAWLIGMPLL